MLASLVAWAARIGRRFSDCPIIVAFSAIVCCSGEDDHAPSIPAEPTGTVEVAGHVVNAQGAAPYTRTAEKVLESASPAQLTNLWDAPLYDGVLTLSAEVPENQKIPLAL